MSNRITIQFTRFQNIDEHGNETENHSFCYRIYDDYAQVYDNTYDNLSDLIGEVNPDTLLDVLSQHKEFEDVAVENTNGIFFNGEYFEMEKLLDK
jgi:hypothetical protein